MNTDGRTGRPPMRVRDAWNFSRNLRSLLTPPPGSFQHIDGLRGFASFWMISYHVLFYIGMFLPARFLPQYSELVQNPWLRLVEHGQVGLDIFFAISGFLIAHLLLVEHQKTGHIQVRRFYIRRAFRLFPTYSVALIFYCSLIGVNCDTVWANILYINNFLPVTRQCMAWTWSLAIEEQFYIIFPACLILLLRLKRHRVTIFLALLALSVLINWVLVRSGGFSLPINFHPRLHGDMEDYTRYFDTLYCKPHTRYGGILMGVFVAYLYNRTGFIAWFSRLRHASLIGAGFLAVSFGVLLLPDLYFTPWHPVASTLYMSGGRLLFAAATCGITVVCLSSTAAGKMINAVLSLRFWYPLAQLSYSVYLLHPTVIIICYVTWLKPRTPGLGMLVVYFLIISAITHLLSLLVYFGIERPMMNLRRHPRVLRWEKSSGAVKISREDRLDEV